MPENQRSWLNKINLFLFCILYIGAGINHFWHPATYLDLIPPYLPWKTFINYFSGVCEIGLGLLMLISFTRKLAVILIIAMLVAFIPAHIYWIHMNGCVSARLCQPAWVAWIRLFPFQFILIWWAWKTYKWNKGKTNTI